MRARRLLPALIAVAALGAACGAGPGSARGAAAPAASPALSIWSRGAWRAWWRAAAAPTRWTAADTTVAAALAWRRVADGVELSSARLSGSWPAWRTRLIVARLDPRRLSFSLVMSLSGHEDRPAWTIDDAPPEALLAVNAGQFLRTMPWGWLVMEGHERLRPGTGPLAGALAFDAAGGVRWIAGDSLARGAPATAPGIETAFQSYPTLLADDGVVPEPLRAAGRGVDLEHRDARLAIGETRDGRLVLALTRFDALGETAGGTPIGLTTPEMAAVMGALGCRDAMMLDGGISAQLTLRDPARGRRWRWPGWRKVPLAMIVRSR